MPKKKDSAETEVPDNAQQEFPRERTTKYNVKPKVTIPLTSDGRVDGERLTDKSVLEKARFALGMSEVSAPLNAEPQKLVPREMIPFLYDGLAAAFRIGVRAFKWPKAATPEERAEIVSYMEYSAEFKEKATEPTALLLDKLGSNSRLMKWFAANQEAAVVLFMVYAGTMEMFTTAAQKFSFEKAKREAVDAATTGKVNGGFPASENRGPSVVAVGAR